MKLKSFCDRPSSFCKFRLLLKVCLIHRYLLGVTVYLKPAQQALPWGTGFFGVLPAPFFARAKRRNPVLSDSLCSPTPRKRLLRNLVYLKSTFSIVSCPRDVRARPIQLQIPKCPYQITFFATSKCERANYLLGHFNPYRADYEMRERFLRLTFFSWAFSATRQQVKGDLFVCPKIWTVACLIHKTTKMCL